MEYQLLTLLLIFATNFEISWSLALNCTFELKPFEPVGEVYTCNAGVLLDGSDTVTFIYGTHQDGKTDDDVHGFALRSQGLEFIPRNIDAFFENLKALDIYNNLISNISNDHLSPFKKLVHFAITDNNIISLDSNLFRGLSSLSYVNFYNNTIKHVGHDFILPNSGEINFESNYCIDQLASTDEEIDSLRFNLLLKCPPTISHIEDTLEDRPNMLTRNSIELQILTERVKKLESIIGSIEYCRCKTLP